MTRRVNPVILLIVLALIPAVAFASLWRWADARYQESILIEPDPVSQVVAPLATPVLSVRRAPEALSDSLVFGALRNALDPVAALVSDTSCLVVSEDSRVVVARGGELPVTPASNLKLLTGAAALEILGADYRYVTELRGVVANGTIAGDLYFVGGGDPLLSTQGYAETQKHPPTSVTSLETLVANLVAAGVTQVNGNIVADDSRYDAERAVPSWSLELVGTEVGPLSALMVNDGVRDLANQRRYDDVAVGAATELRNLLKASNIKLGGKVVAGITPPEAQMIASVQSAPFSDVLTEMLTTSDNNTAELVLKEIGVRLGAGGNRLGGIGAVRGVLVTWGIDVTPLVQIDGSGLDRGNQVTCGLLSAVINHELDNPLFVKALPTAGQPGSTLDDELLDSSLVGILRAKTGSLSDVKALAGTAPSASGEVEFALVLIAPAANQEQVYRPIWLALANALASAQSTPAVELLQPR